MTTILGINAYHPDSSACLLIDGQLVAAAEEERFTRIKHYAGFPEEAIRYCLNSQQISLSDLHHIAINTNPKKHLLKKIAYVMLKRPSIAHIKDRITNQKKRLSLDSLLKEAFPESPFSGNYHWIEHHMAHMASAYYVSPFDKASVVSIDGFGDFASAAWGYGESNQLTLENQVFYPHSLGLFYQAITQYLGFLKYGDEYKVMGLASYGKPTYIKQMSDIVKLHSNGNFSLNLKFFRHNKEKINYTWNKGAPSVGCLYTTALESLFGKQARNPQEIISQFHKDIACSAQVLYEKALFNLLNNISSQHTTTNLALAGGCAMNSVANGKISLNTPYKKIYVQPAAGDAGGAIGAALVVANQVDQEKKRFSMQNAYYGPSFKSQDIGCLLQKQEENLNSYQCIKNQYKQSSLIKKIIDNITQGKIIGIYQGRMEWGPRALGNRSIICDPRKANMRDVINAKIKKRELFRPFAPAILREHVKDWFDQDDDVPFMMKVFNIKPEQRNKIPAVVHIDGTGRLQTVTNETNPWFYCLLQAFYEKTGIPILLNTSLNENEPIVCTPQEALDCFLRTKMDLLIMEDWCIERTK